MLLDVQGVILDVALRVGRLSVSGAPIRSGIGASSSPPWLPIAGAIGAVFGAFIAGAIGLANSRYTLRAQRELTKLTLDEQRRTTQETLDEQHQTTQQALDHQRERLFNERFATAADKLGHLQAATRMAGVYAFAGLADDWKVQRQTCVDVLCGYMRLPWQPTGDADGDSEGEKEVRLSLIRVIRDHLRKTAETPWRGLRFRFQRVCFTDGDLSEIVVPHGGYMSFYDAEFKPGRMDFHKAELCGCTVDFDRAKFLGGVVDFRGATLAGSRVKFKGATLGKGSVIDFRDATFTDGTIEFDEATFAGGTVNFQGANFSGGTVEFNQATFAEGMVNFQGVNFSGGTVDLARAVFCGGTVDLREPAVYSAPAKIPDSVPTGLLLPSQHGRDA